MRANRFWTGAAHLALAIVIVVQTFFTSLAMVEIVPAYVKNRGDGLLYGNNGVAQDFVSQADWYLHNLIWVCSHWLTWLVVAAVVWGLFEWRVRSENKSWMRLSALGTVAGVMAMVMGAMASSLVVLYVIAVPTLYARQPEPIVLDGLANVDLSLSDLDAAMANPDWAARREQAMKAYGAVRVLSDMGAAAPTLVSLPERMKIDEVRANLKSASDFLFEAQNAMAAGDAARTDAALQGFRKAYAQVPHAATLKPAGANVSRPGLEPAAANEL